MIIKTKRMLLFSMVFLAVILSRNQVSADDKARDRQTLQGIQSIVVKVHSVDEEWRNELAKVGLSESALQATIEHQLQKAGMRWVKRKKPLKKSMPKNDMCMPFGSTSASWFP